MTKTLLWSLLWLAVLATVQTVPAPAVLAVPQPQSNEHEESIEATAEPIPGVGADVEVEVDVVSGEGEEEQTTEPITLSIFQTPIEAEAEPNPEFEFVFAVSAEREREKSEAITAPSVKQAQTGPNPNFRNPDPIEAEAEPIPVDEFDVVSGEGEEEPTEPITEPDSFFQDSTNPLNPAGDSLERLIQMQINEDVWLSLLGDLPCLDASEACVRELQELAVANNYTLAEIDVRIEAINERIEVARTNNQRTIRLGIFEPLWQDLITLRTVARVPDPGNPPAPGSEVVPEQRGFLDNVLNIFRRPVQGVNSILSLIGLPLFRSVSGGDAAAQQRSIAIADLQVKVAEVERQRGEMANRLREEVLLSVLDFERTRREFQGYQEMGRRSQLRNDILRLNYRFVADSMSTPQYLAEQNALDRGRLEVFRNWAQLRTQLTKIKIVVLGAESI